MQHSTWRAAGLPLAALLAALLAAISCAPPSERTAAGSEVVERAYRERISDIVVEVEGTVERILPDDTQGARHQRFILRLPSGHTLLVAHNLDVGERVPIAVGDRVSARGEYEWNDKGGVLHWTHRDPSGRRPGGWIGHGGRRYR